MILILMMNEVKSTDEIPCGQAYQIERCSASTVESRRLERANFSGPKVLPDQKFEILTSAINDKTDRAFPISLSMIRPVTPQTLKLINDVGDLTFVRFSLEPIIKTQYYADEKTADLASLMPDYYSRELFTAIDSGSYPEWELRAQIITPKIVDELEFNPFDPTKVWDESTIPSMPVGKLVLNKNPSNYFSQIEQLAFNPINLVPGIEINHNDQVLQSRGQAYLDAQLYRLGSSFGEHQMNKPVLPKAPQVREKDQNNGEMDANYFLNSFGLTGNSLRGYSSPERIGSPLKVKRHSTVEEDNYSQLNKTWISWSKSEQNRVVTRLWKEFSALERFIRDAALKQIKLINIEFYEKFLPLLEQTSGW